MNATRKGWLITLALSGLALAYVFAIFLPQQRVVRQLREELQAKQDFALQAAGLDVVVAASRRELSAANEFVKRGRSAMPEVDGIANAFEAIHRRAESAGMQTERFEPQSPVALQTLTQTPVVLETTGSFHQIFDLIALLEEADASIWIDQVQIEKVSESSESLACETSLAIFADNRKNSD